VKSLRSRKPALSEAEGTATPFPAARTHQGISPSGPSFYLFTTEVITGEVGYPPPPLVSWNHRVRRKFSVRSLKLKDLQVRSLITNDLASVSRLVVRPACPIDNLGRENGLFFLDHSVVIKDRPNPASPPENGIFEAKSYRNGFRAASMAVSGDGRTSTLS